MPERPMLRGGMLNLHALKQQLGMAARCMLHGMLCDACCIHLCTLRAAAWPKARTKRVLSMECLQQRQPHAVHVSRICAALPRTEWSVQSTARADRNCTATHTNTNNIPHTAHSSREVLQCNMQHGTSNMQTYSMHIA